MKTKNTFPDWTGIAGRIITRNGEEGKHPVWRAYDQDVADNFLALRVSLEITGGSTLFETFNSEEEHAAAQKEASRRVTWKNALSFAEQMWRAAPHREYIVLFMPESKATGRERICIYQRLSPYPATGKAAQ